MKEIEIYTPATFTARFMQSTLQRILKPEIGKFFIVRVEDIYQLITQSIPASRSSTNSCLFITEGVARMKVGSQSYTIRKDEMLLVPAGQVFSFEEGDVNKGYFCNFHSDMLAGWFNKFEFLRVWGNPMIRLDVQRAEFVLHLFQRLLFDYTQHGLDNPDIIQLYLLTLLSEVKQAYQPLSDDNNLMSRFKELIFSKIKSLHQVSDYASLLNITPNHLSKTVKTLSGKSPTKWIDEAIVLEAKVLLVQSEFTISEVANEVGIEDASYFSRLFKKYEGVTPSDFRKMIEKS